MCERWFDAADRKVVNFYIFAYFCAIKRFVMINENVLLETTPIEVSDYTIERNKPMPNRIHGVIQSAIAYLLYAQYRERYQISSEVSLDTMPVTTPDILIFHKKKLDWKTIEAREKEMPITTIEIISPSQSIEELAEKAWETYFPSGVQSAWIVVPALKTVTILTFDDQRLVFSQGELLDPITGIQLSLESIFECMV